MKDIVLNMISNKIVGQNSDNLCIKDNIIKF